ncbi:FUSC family protein [Micromonospora sp. DR5-3]|uniref:FUSC family protein n=1 Tax=unclassified Micromonospora TaxID=2617518 RepID=UPI0016525AB1|nr:MULTISPECIES: FUSC family protein [unclassified Micromonospora]MCW3816160.1 FUSC family protein [Micromonospora sp. DR5-3]
MPIAVISVQAGLATAAAWIIATDYLGRNAPVFAPAAALATIASATGQRTRQTVELLIGVGLGITVSDAVLYLIGSGAWQIAIVVFSSVALALLVAGRSGALVSQAGATATLFATLSGNQRSLELPRIIDAAVGASVGFLAVALLLPLDPLRGVEHAAKPFFTNLAAAIHTTAQALAAGDRDLAVRTLGSFDGVAADTTRLDEALRAAGEVVSIAPWWRHRRSRYQQYRAAVDQLHAFATNVRVMARRVATLLEYHEPVPPSLPQAVQTLGDALTDLHRERATARASGRTRQTALEAARLAGQAERHQAAHEFGETVVLQIRSAASDLLRATGASPQEANRLVRDAATGEQNGR